ncbi:uncharacterized protein TRIVIDRAFT_183126 [Trichoderma virens Gv29-8]|uniref:Uncharacterized protein n=1 Tax=Hypocrea virens (strain Gv29-8 / FGSC 10586) TaxID=413071 RepID=G9N6G3_HYPVG|nr:uncharacterized protein TRIVIDRAFT_183126 [Trichoderma virens Gv29-8]EHK17724.1 hypothetical protein TRIVIDRAFT_183126 [Trichoderma virens Gv29-8]
MTSISRHDVNALLRQVQGNSLFNRQLSSICQVNGLKSTGVKAELQRRIVQPSAYGTYGFSFKPSPFYYVEGAVSVLRTSMAQHRNSVTIPLRLSDHPIVQRCNEDKSYRIMVFCASDDSGLQDVAFPHQSELRVNGDEIKANLRGLKNKPGSTRPVDITNTLRLRGNYMNNIEFTYALTSRVKSLLTVFFSGQKYYLIVNICKTTSVPELVTTISNRRKISEESVISELNKIAQDPDVVATSQVLSLKCPLSYMRLEVPCRSLSCTHLQCFDATSYLQLQEQGPQWLCPICNKSAPFDQLAVDGYVKVILENTSKSLETVTIEPNGKWSSKPPKEETSSRPNGAALEDDDDDDDVEVSEIIIGGRRIETPKHMTPYKETPGSGGADGGSAPRGSTHSAKRPTPAVIDLTLSSDDEEPIQRPHKRQHTGTSSYRGSSSLPFLSESPSNYPS